MQVQAAFGLEQPFKAARLQRRASDMLHRGFEWTLLHGEPRNPAAHRYPLTPPCCDMRMLGTEGRCRRKLMRCVLASRAAATCQFFAADAGGLVVPQLALDAVT